MKPPQVHLHPDVALVRSVYLPAARSISFPVTVADFLAKIQEALWTALQNGHRAFIVEFRNWHPRAIGKSESEILDMEWSLQDSRLVVARSHGFLREADLKQGDSAFMDPDFERAVDFLLDGERSVLEALLDEKPDLLSANSAFGHRAGLIHYVAANGVETWRQVMPLNLTDMLALLLEKGANPHAPHNIYGGDASLATLIESSAHPKESGLRQALLDQL